MISGAAEVVSLQEKKKNVDSSVSKVDTKGLS